MARILWVSDTPYRSTGFGLVSGEICRRLARLGHDVLMLGWWSSQAVTYYGIEVRPCPVSPKEAGDSIAGHAASFRAQYLVTLADVPWVCYLAADELRSWLGTLGIKWFLYYPIDGTLVNGRLPAEWVRVLSRTDLPVAMSSFGAHASSRSGIPAIVIPHGCDTELFRPPDNKDEAKRRWGYQGKFVVLSDVRNHRRKLIPRALDIIQRLGIPRCQLAFHLHTSAHSQEDGESYRYDVLADIELLGLRLTRGVRADAEATCLDLPGLADLYAAADVHLLASYGEGFGLPTLQAASAGVVPVAAATSASIELVGDHGFAVPCDSWTTDEFGIVREFIDRRKAASVLRRLHDDPALLNARAAAARKFALSFSWDRVAGLWDALFRVPLGSPLAGPSASWSRPRNRPAPAITPVPRPTGHDPAVLPIPRIGIPTRLELRGTGALAATAPIVLVEASWALRLRVLERLFPGTTVRGLARRRLPGLAKLEQLMAATTLMVDPDGRLPPCDLICALRGLNFLGKSPLWPTVPGRTWLARARRLLTDFAYSERRAAAAAVRARASGGAPRGGERSCG